MAIPIVVGQERFLARAGQSATAVPPFQRIASIDILRGLVMILMALDHTRDFFTKLQFDPTDLTRTTLEIFLTRWVTHFCAPVFVFLTGMSAYLVSQRRTKPELSRYLLTRGVWLVLVEVTIVRFAWLFNFDYHFLFLQVIWAIGISLIVLAGLVHLPITAIGAFGLVMIAGHNAFDGIQPQSFGAFDWLWTMLHVQGPLPLPWGGTMFVAYPVVPWVGVMAAGFAFGPVLKRDPHTRRRTMVLVGVGLTLAFLLFRGLNGYGDPRPWTHQQTGEFTFMSFLNTTKYPPSLDYLLMTLGPSLILLAAFEFVPPMLAAPVATFGRVPFFYYVAHILLIHALAVVAALMQVGDASFLFSNQGLFQHPAAYGFRLRYVYVIWMVVIVLLYPACRWFAVVKETRREWWLSYL